MRYASCDSQLYVGSAIGAEREVNASVSASAVAFADYAMSCCGVSSTSSSDMVLLMLLQC